MARNEDRLKQTKRTNKNYPSASYLTSSHSHFESTEGTCWNKKYLSAKLPGSARPVKSTYDSFPFVLSLVRKVLETGVGRALEWGRRQNKIQFTLFTAALAPSWKLQKLVFVKYAALTPNRPQKKPGPGKPIAQLLVPDHKASWWSIVLHQRMFILNLTIKLVLLGLSRRVTK